jgi:hypothetical protein
LDAGISVVKGHHYLCQKKTQGVEGHNLQRRPKGGRNMDSPTDENRSVFMKTDKTDLV